MNKPVRLEKVEDAPEISTTDLIIGSVTVASITLLISIIGGLFTCL